MGIYYGVSLEREFPFGLSSEGGFTKVNESIYFVSDQNIHVFDGNRVFNIGDGVITDFESASSLANVSVFYVEGKDRLLFSIRAEKVLVFNVKHNVWTKYNAAFAFRGFLKNYANVYMAWDDDTLFELYDGSTNDAEDAGGGNGNVIPIIYESPLFAGNGKGNMSILDTHRHRIYKGADVLTFTVYDYKTTGKTSVATQALGAPTSGTDALSKTYFFNKVMGESFSFRISGNVTDGKFKYYGLTVDVREGGVFYR